LNFDLPLQGSLDAFNAEQGRIVNENVNEEEEEDDEVEEEDDEVEEEDDEEEEEDDEEEEEDDEEEEEKRGFDRGLTAERIIGATDNGGELKFVMKWGGSDLVDLVSAKEANEKCPEVVIKFYEERFTLNGSQG
jgi:archaellum component FlaD/FlaE